MLEQKDDFQFLELAFDKRTREFLVRELQRQRRWCLYFAVIALIAMCGLTVYLHPDDSSFILSLCLLVVVICVYPAIWAVRVDANVKLLRVLDELAGQGNKST